MCAVDRGWLTRSFVIFYVTVVGSGAALSVEMTSYILLSLVKLGSNDDLLKARSIVRWLSKQRNSEGGFISTQDTVVALQVFQKQKYSKIVSMKALISTNQNCRRFLHTLP